MNYNVSQLLKEPIGSHREFTIPDGGVSESIRIAAGRPGKASMVRTHHGIWVTAWMAVRVDQDCSRCLADFSETLELEIEEEFFPEVDVKSGRRVFAPDDWEGFYIGNDHMLDLAEATRQSALALLPLKPLCRPDCVGICDRCGLDLNRAQCDCYNEAIDPRWATLRSLLTDPQK